MEKDHLEVLLEEMKGKFDLVLAGIDIILHEIQETRQELGEKIDMNTFRLRAMGGKVGCYCRR